jgi:hypothetical protein
MSTAPQPPYRLDVHGTDQHGENAALRERGPVTLVELPGGLTAWAVTGQDELQTLLGDSTAGSRGWRRWGRRHRSPRSSATACAVCPWRSRADVG